MLMNSSASEIEVAYYANTERDDKCAFWANIKE